MSKQPWSDAEDHLIEKYYDTRGVGYVMEKMPHRNKGAIRQRASLLNQKKYSKPEPIEIIPSEPIARLRYEIRKIEEQVHKLEAKRAELIHECNRVRAGNSKHTGCARRVA